MEALSLPYPPSTNRLTRHGNGRAYASPQAAAWKRQAAWLAKAAGVRVTALPVAVSVLLHPKANKDGSASKTRIDIDNAIKAALDALNGVAWLDDKQVIRLSAEVSDPLENGGLTIEWKEA